MSKLYINNKYALTYSTEKNIKYSTLENSNTLFINCNKYIKDNTSKKNIIKNNVNNINSEKHSLKPSSQINDVYRVHKNSLLWILYILIHSYEEYKYLSDHQYFSKEQEFRYALIDNIKKTSDNKLSQLKVRKIKIKEIISELGNGSQISINTFIGLCMLLNINICLLKNCIGFLQTNSDIDSINVISLKTNSLYIKNLSVKECTEKYYLVDNINKPFKSISSYKADELRQICERLCIDVKINDTKYKTKQNLYRELIDKIEI